MRSRAEFVWIGSGWYPNSTTLYVYDGRRVVQERNSANGPTVSYVRGLDLSGTAEGAGGIGGLLARSSGYQTATGSWTSHAFYHADGGGNVTFLSPSTYSGTMTRYSYDAYGRSTSENGPLATANVYRFSSKELHAASGHYYYGYRFYDPQAQRWINRDPIGEAGGMNLYGFVGNGPTTWVDGTGEKITVIGTQMQLENFLACAAILGATDHGNAMLQELSKEGSHVTVNLSDGNRTAAWGRWFSPDGTWRGGASLYGNAENLLDPSKSVWNGVTALADKDGNPTALAPLSEVPVNNALGGAVVLGHELGHVLGQTDECPDIDNGPPTGVSEGTDLGNVGVHENSIRLELGVPLRTSYHGFPVSAYPGFPTSTASWMNQ